MTLIKNIDEAIRNHRNFKNFIGGMLLIIGVSLFYEYDLIWYWRFLIYIPAWLILFSWNY